MIHFPDLFAVRKGRYDKIVVLGTFFVPISEINPVNHKNVKVAARKQVAKYTIVLIISKLVHSPGVPIVGKHRHIRICVF